MISFATTVFLSAFLLFQIQPIIAKMILPWFGGSSSVWSTCLVFFQAELLLGYLYVHLLHEWLPPRRQNLVHGVLLLLSLATLPVIADPAWKDAAFESPTWNVLVVLASAVGMPYLLLSTTGPLMQAWYARSFASMMPYRLYALSNLASMLALLSYPVLVEPYFPVLEQAWAWSAAYVLFVLACLAVPGNPGKGYRASENWRRVRPAPPRTARPSWRECLLWVSLAMTASILLLAITRHLTQDVAPVPFLWVLPLSIYLLSFILCFDAPRYYYRPGFLVALPIAFLALDQVVDGGSMPVPVLVALLSLSLFVFCMVCHGELVRRRPAVRHLTLFYLMLSIGGALGGSFVGLLAPAVFNAYFELPIGLFLCALLVIIVLWREVKPVWRWLLVVALLAYGYRLAGISVSYVEDYRRVLRNFYGQLRVSDVATKSWASSARSCTVASITASSSSRQIIAGDQRPTIASNQALARPCSASPATRRERSACWVLAPARWPPMASRAMRCGCTKSMNRSSTWRATTSATWATAQRASCRSSAMAA
ncbi:MAG: hypothetical protein V5B38_12615 [Candidatus Accumulibacter propinquus]|jgi:hypothetical protein